MKELKSENTEKRSQQRWRNSTKSVENKNRILSMEGKSRCWQTTTPLTDELEDILTLWTVNGLQRDRKKTSYNMAEPGFTACF